MCNARSVFPTVSKVTPFHIEHGTRPHVVFTFLKKGREARECLGITPISWSKISPFLQQLGLATRDGNLSPFGRKIAADVHSVNDTAEVILLWLRYAYRFSEKYHFSFAFRQVIIRLDKGQIIPLRQSDRDTFVQGVQQACRERYDLPSVAFSDNSLLAAMRWLQALHPSPLIETDKGFSLRRRSDSLPVASFFLLQLLLALENAHALRIDENLYFQIKEALLLESIEQGQAALENALTAFPERLLRTASGVALRKVDVS
jgi:hypothetical protein